MNQEQSHGSSRSDQKAGGLPSSGTPLCALALSCCEQIRKLQQDPRWGHPKGIPGVILNAAAVTLKQPGLTQELKTQMAELLKVIEQYRDQPIHKPQEVVALLRQTLFGDSFVTSAAFLRLASARGGISLSAADMGSFEARLESALFSLVSSTSAQVVTLLEEGDEDDLAERWEKLTRRLEPSEPGDISIDGMNLTSILDLLPTVFEAARNPADPRGNLAKSWLKERAEDKQFVISVLDLLVTNRAGKPFIKKADSGPLAQTVPDAVAPKVNQPAKLQVELPKSSLLDGIDGVEDVGVGDKRSTTPQNKGNVGVDKRAGMAPHMREKLERQERKAKDTAERMKAANVKPIPPGRKPSALD